MVAPVWEAAANEEALLFCSLGKGWGWGAKRGGEGCGHRERINGVLRGAAKNFLKKKNLK